MLGLALSNDTMFCLGIMFMLVGILFFYIKKQITHLEHAQMEQAKLLQSIIMSLNSGPPGQMMGNQEEMLSGNTNNYHAEMGMGNGNVKENSLIDVSDGEDDSDDSDDESNDSEDSDNESSSSENTDNALIDSDIQLSSINDIDEDSIVEIPNTVKVVAMTSSGLLDEPEEIIIDENSLSDDDEDDDDDDDDDDSLISNNTTDLAKPSLKTLKVGDLRKLVVEKGLHEDPTKIKKNELIELLEKQ